MPDPAALAEAMRVDDTLIELVDLWQRISPAQRRLLVQLARALNRTRPRPTTFAAIEYL